MKKKLRVRELRITDDKGRDRIILDGETSNGAASIKIMSLENLNHKIEILAHPSGHIAIGIFGENHAQVALTPEGVAISDNEGKPAAFFGRQLDKKKVALSLDGEGSGFHIFASPIKIKKKKTKGT